MPTPCLRQACRRWACGALLVSATAAGAQAPSATAVRLEAETEPPVDASPAPAVVRTLLWRQREALGVGVGLQWRQHTAWDGRPADTWQRPALALGVSWVGASDVRWSWSVERPIDGPMPDPMRAALLPPERPAMQLQLSVSRAGASDVGRLLRGQIAQFDAGGGMRATLRVRGQRVGLHLARTW